ncbi:MAG TPA: ATP-dependent DNA helicase RecG [Nevskiaceae bacterium]
MARPGADRRPAPRLRLQDDAVWLKGAGPLIGRKLAGLGVRRVVDVLLHLPIRYEDRRRLTPLDQVRAGHEALVLAKIGRVQLAFTPRRNLWVTLVGDGRMATAMLQLRLFHFSEAQRKGLVEGRWVCAYGPVRAGARALEMIHPQYRVADDRQALAIERGWIAVYGTTAGVTQARIRLLVARAFDVAQADGALARPLADFVGSNTIDALRALHYPAADADASALLDAAHPLRLRLATEELLAHQLALQASRAGVRERRAPVIADMARSVARLQRALPFELTRAQQRAMKDIAVDLASGHPMLRLLQGDVGSGKTLVAVAAMAACAGKGRQAVLMAPTELLAEQHQRTLSRLLQPLGENVGLLSSRLKATEKKAALEAAAAGTTHLWVGTHALLQGSVRFARLVLVVVDEQHRFGVGQRLALADKGEAGEWVHQLVMSATPIPRTLAQVVYADLDISTLDELPPGRTPVTTVVLNESRRGAVLRRIGAACAAGRQAYWVCTLIEESEQLQAQTAEDTHAQLCAELPGLAVGLVHGRMKPADKERQMRAFVEGQTQVLVATTVIEVGVDVPNASIMVIDNAERLGLAQLHQLRGRVGRGQRASQCVLMYRAPLSGLARSRLQVLRETHDGFRIAERDLQLRGPGELLGRRQTGMVGLKVADPMRDAMLMPAVRRRAADWLQRHPVEARRLIERWIPEAGRYAQV